MKLEERTVQYDKELGIEAYHFKGLMQKFPNHFHEHYVIGFVEMGKRHLSCKNRSYTIDQGDIVLFNPMDNHTCEQIDDKTLDYRCLNIKPEIMRAVTLEITGTDYLPRFAVPVVCRSSQVDSLRELHRMIMEEQQDFEKEELFYFLMKQLIENDTELIRETGPIIIDEEIQMVCDYLEREYSGRITLDDLAGLGKRNKYSLLRAFTKAKGITPYRYLETLRVNQAKKLLELGCEPIEAAMQAGFSDQSHFTNFFKNFIGLTPGQYRDIFMDNKGKGAK